MKGKLVGLTAMVLAAGLSATAAPAAATAPAAAGSSGARCALPVGRAGTPPPAARMRPSMEGTTSQRNQLRFPGRLRMVRSPMRASSSMTVEGETMRSIPSARTRG
jgi:hypothetical protein